MAGLTQRTPRSARSDALANRQRILEAAREAFARRGLDAEIREIAERAGVGVGTLYRHFQSREGLLAALFQQINEHLLRRLQAAVETEDPRAAVREMIQAGAEAFGQYGALTEVMFSAQLHKLHSGHPDFREFLVNVLRRGIREGIFRSDLDVPVAVVALGSIFTSGALHELAAQRSYPGAADAVADFFLGAIAEPKRSESG